MKKVLRYLIMFFCLFFCSSLTCLAATPNEVQLFILHTNDTHCRILPGDDRGRSIGFAEIAAAVKKIRLENPDTLFLDAGDTFHGQPLINISRGQNLVPIINAMGYNAMSPGNHDFDYGSKQLQKLAPQLNFSVLSANVVDAKTGKLLFAPYKIFDLNGLKVGVFGLTTPETAFKSNPSGVKNVHFLNPITVAKKMVRELRPKCDIIVAIMHMGVDPNSRFTSKKIAQNVKGINVIIDGHSHTVLEHGIRVGNTLIAQTGYYDHYLGLVKLTIKGDKVVSSSAQLLDNAQLKAIASTPDAKVTAEIKTLQQKNKPYFESFVAQSNTFLPSSNEMVRTRETKLGNLVADAIRYDTNSDVAFVNGGSIRSSLAKGPVTKGEALAILPFGNTIKKVSVSGQTLLSVLEHSVAKYPISFGGFLQVSGVTFSFDPQKAPGSRVSNVYVDGKPLKLQKSYSMSATDFMLVGGDGYTMLKGAKLIGEYGSCEEALIKYLQKEGIHGIDKARIDVLGAKSTKIAA